MKKMINAFLFPTICGIAVFCNAPEGQTKTGRQSENSNESTQSNDDSQIHYFGDTLLIKRNSNSTGCTDAFVISPLLENDSIVRRDLGCFIANALIGGYEDRDMNFEKIYRLSSFKTIILKFFDGDFDYLNTFESEDSWNDNQRQLLYNVQDKLTLHELTDSLLKKENDAGLVVLWDKVDPKLLTSWLPFFKTVQKEKNVYKIVELLFICHNSKLYVEEKKLLATVSGLSDFKSYKGAVEALLRKQSVSYDELSEVLYE